MYRIALSKNGSVEYRRTNSITLAAKMIERADETHHLVGWSASPGGDGPALSRLLASRRSLGSGCVTAPECVNA